MVANEEKKKNRLLWIILIFIILIMLVSNKTVKKKVHDLFYRNDKSLQLIDNININWPQPGKIRVYKDRVIRYSAKEISQYDIEGTEGWKKAIEDNNTIAYLGENTIYITSTVTGNVTAFDLNGNQLWEYSAKQPIRRISERNGYLVLFTQAGKSTEQINILDDKGKLQANATTDKGKILSCSVSPDRKEFSLVTLDVTDGSISSNLMYFKMNGQEIWRKNYKDQIIYDVLFLDNNNMIAVCDSKILSLSVKNELLWSRTIEDGLKDIKVDTNSKTIYVLCGQANPNLEIILGNGRTENKIELDNNYDNIYINKKYILLRGKKTIAGVNSNRINLKYNCTEEIKGIGVYNDNILIFTEKNTLITKPISVDN